MVKPLFLSDAGFPVACLSHSPPKVLGGGYILSSFEKAREIGFVKTRVDKKKYSARNLVSLSLRSTTVAKRINEIVKTLIRGSSCELARFSIIEVIAKVISSTIF